MCVCVCLCMCMCMSVLSTVTNFGNINQLHTLIAHPEKMQSTSQVILLFYLSFFYVYVVVGGEHECMWPSEVRDMGSHRDQHGCWESSPGPLQEQSMLLTAESSPQFYFFLLSFYNEIKIFLSMAVPVLWNEHHFIIQPVMNKSGHHKLVGLELDWMWEGDP